MIDLYKLQEIAQLVEAMNEAVLKLEDAQSNQDHENIEKAKKSILDFRDQIDGVLG